MNNILYLYILSGSIFILIAVIVYIILSQNKRINKALCKNLSHLNSLLNNDSSEKYDKATKLQDILKITEENIILKNYKIIHLNEEINKKDDDINILRCDVDDKINDILIKEKNISTLKEELNNANEKVESQKEEIEFLNRDINFSKRQIEKNNNRLDKQKTEIKHLTESIEKQKSEINDLNETIDESNEKIRKKDKHIQYVENLLNSVLNIINAENENNKNLEEYKKIISIDSYQKTSKFLFMMLYELNKIYYELEEIEKNIHVYQKNIVSVGGGFSAGKSSFINTLFDNNNDTTLPTGDLPMTSIPSYIIDSDEAFIECLTLNNKKVKIDKEIFDKISVKNNSEEDYNNQLNPKNIIKHFYINDKLKKEVKNICFIDTPGYDPAKGTKEDRETAIEYISNTNNLIFVINIDDGDIADKGVYFINEVIKIKKNINIYVICNRADEKGEDDIKKFCDDLYKRFETLNIKILGMTPYTSKNLETNNYYFYNFKYGMSFNEFLKILNTNNGNEKYRTIKNKIDNIFENYRNTCEEVLNECQKYKKELVHINNKYILDTSYLEKLVYTYRAKLDYKDLENDKGIEKKKENINLNIDEIKRYINNITEEYNEYISDSHDIQNKIMQCINNIFNIQ
ncbi:dynamin family protein [Brachyspira pulli]|uniref:dynamin family protein n=1 Tax=Brachyspira pulli TaxID=310721 RepID=UPI00300752CB